MKFLFCSVNSPGFLYPCIGVAKALIKQGHEVAFATDRSYAGLLSEQGLTYIPRSDKKSSGFVLAQWFHPLAVAMQHEHLQYAVRQFGPDMLVGQTLTLGTYLAAEKLGLPLAVMGTAGYFWLEFPSSDDAQTRYLNRYIKTRSEDFWATWCKVRQALGFSTQSSDAGLPFLGDLYFLRNMPSLYPDADSLPDRVHFVGDCLWEPSGSHLALSEKIADALNAGKKVVYAQAGRSFREPNFWKSLTSVCGDASYLVIADISRMDERAAAIPVNFVTADFIPQQQILPYADIVITNGTSTAVLGALRHGVPLLVLPRGGETPDLAERVHLAGAGVRLPLSEADPERFCQALASLSDQKFRDRCKVLSLEFQRLDGHQTCASRMIEYLANTKNTACAAAGAKSFDPLASGSFTHGKGGHDGSC